MVRWPLSTGWLILALGSATVTAAAQQTPAKPVPGNTPSASSTKAQKHIHHKKKLVEAPQPEVPPPPPTPEQSPAAAPEVSYHQGELTIRSENSTLRSILDAVKSSLGATVDAPGTTSSDRIATQIGPGDPHDVLTTLLNNSKYDFVLLGNPGSPQSVQKIILTARATAGGASPSATPPPARQAFQPAQPDQDQEIPDAEIPDESSQPEQPQPEPQPEAQPEPQGPVQTFPQPGLNQPGVQPEGGEQQNPNQPKTPEQLLQELQRMQQQQQQQQPQQNPQDR
jgi:hypothetical protein